MGGIAFGIRDDLPYLGSQIHYRFGFEAELLLQIEPVVGEARLARLARAVVVELAWAVAEASGGE